MKKSAFKPINKPSSESNTQIFQPLSVVPKHRFQWSRGVATCSCGYWTLWGASLESAKRSHAYHRRNRFEVESQPVGQIEPHAKDNKPSLARGRKKGKVSTEQ